MRHTEGEGDDEVLIVVEGDYRLVSVMSKEVVGCVRCIVLDPCVIPVSIIRMYDVIDVRSRSECRRAAPTCTAKCS